MSKTLSVIRAGRRAPPEISAVAVPRYDVRYQALGPGEYEFSIWQLPSPATPGLASPHRMATLYGRNLALVEHRVLRRLSQAGVRLDSRARGLAERKEIGEHSALVLGLLFRCLAPMRNRERIRDVAEGIDAMSREEAAYWLGMAMHRKHPRRVLNALRVLLTDPNR